MKNLIIALVLVFVTAGCRDWNGDGVNRIVTVGDSNTAPFGVPEEMSYPSQLQTLLDTVVDPEGKPYEIINAGVYGEGAVDAVNRNRIGPYLASSDTIVIAYGGDILLDLGFWIPPGTRPNSVIVAAFHALYNQVQSAGRMPILATIPHYIVFPNDPEMQEELVDSRIDYLNNYIRTNFVSWVEFDIVNYPEHFIDYWHMNEEGHALRALSVFNFLRR